MKEKVYVTVKGLHAGMSGEQSGEDEHIEVINVGLYKMVAGHDYVKYEEIYEDGDKSDTIIKIAEKGVDITKKGAVTTHMAFVEGEKTRNLYETPYGSLYMGIYSKRVDIRRGENAINVVIDYSVEVNYRYVSESRVEIRIQDEVPRLADK